MNEISADFGTEGGRLFDIGMMNLQYFTDTIHHHADILRKTVARYVNP